MSPWRVVRCRAAIVATCPEHPGSWPRTACALGAWECGTAASFRGRRAGIAACVVAARRSRQHPGRAPRLGIPRRGEPAGIPGIGTKVACGSRSPLRHAAAASHGRSGAHRRPCRGLCRSADGPRRRNCGGCIPGRPRASRSCPLPRERREAMFPQCAKGRNRFGKVVLEGFDGQRPSVNAAGDRHAGIGSTSAATAKAAE